MQASSPPDPPDRLAQARRGGLEGLLALLADLDGAIEADVARSALAGGVSPVVVTGEVEREVERRLLRTSRFYDEGDW